MGVFGGFRLDRKPGRIMIKTLCCLLAPAVLVAGAVPTRREPTRTDKSVFNLFNPAPAEFLRSLDTDGPGSTESPYTVDAGHFQVEMTLVGHTSDRASFDGVTQRFEAWAIAPVNLKIGLLNHLGAQLLLTNTATSSRQTQSNHPPSGLHRCTRR